MVSEGEEAETDPQQQEIAERAVAKYRQTRAPKATFGGRGRSSDRGVRGGRGRCGGRSGCGGGSGRRSRRGGRVAAPPPPTAPAPQAAPAPQVAPAPQAAQPPQRQISVQVRFILLNWEITTFLIFLQILKVLPHSAH